MAKRHKRKGAFKEAEKEKGRVREKERVDFYGN